MKKIIFAAFVAAIVSVSCNPAVEVNNLKSISATEAYFKPSFSYVTEENGFTKTFKDYRYGFQVYDSIADKKVYLCVAISREKAFEEFEIETSTCRVGNLNGGMLFVKGCDDTTPRLDTESETTSKVTIGKKMIVREMTTPRAEKSWHKVICKMNLIDFEELVNNGSRVFEDAETGFTCTL